MTFGVSYRKAVCPVFFTVFSLLGFSWSPGPGLAASAVRSTYVKASNTGAGDQFGTAVAISDDLMVVGAPGEASDSRIVNGPGNNDLAPNAGAAYIFVRKGFNFWSPEAYLKASDAVSGDVFGRSVAISGNTVVVGAPWKGTNAGAAYVFVRNGSTWTQQAILKGSNTVAGDYFGEAVAVSGDTVVVGASGNDALTGAAYVFVRSGTTWSQQKLLKAANAEPGDRFGYAVAASGDTAVIGAYNEASNASGVDGNPMNNDAPGSGAAYVFVRSGADWSQQAYLKASNTDPSDNFGVAVALSGDTAAVGALLESSAATGVNGNEADNTAPAAGAAYVFVRSGAAWSQQAYLKASNSGENDRFGRSVGLSVDTLVVGAFGEASRATGVDGNQGDNLAPEAGAAYVFVRSGTSWTQDSYRKASNTEAADFFGFSVAVSGKLIVAGAYGEDSSAAGINGNQTADTAPMAGAAYVFDNPLIYLPVILN